MLRHKDSGSRRHGFSGEAMLATLAEPEKEEEFYIHMCDIRFVRNCVR